ncbi:cation diffusion facilitator family transporter [Sorangium sp. So ce1128]
MTHDHHHEAGHAHAHGAPSTGRAFAVGIGLNATFVTIEAVYGVLSGSMALVADAAHNLSDVLGLFLAWGAVVLARRKPSKRRTYGLRRSTVLAALANAVLLLAAVGAVAWEAVGRLRSPRPVEGLTVAAVAAIGVVINGASALLFAKSQQGDANIKAAFLHLAADAGVSLGVVITGLVLRETGWSWLDPAVSLAVSAVILVGTWGLLKDAANLALDAVPGHIDPEEVRSFLARIPGVEDVHDLHIWAMSTTEVALTVHLIVPPAAYHPAFLRDVARELHDRFRIEHATLQVEVPGAPGPCRLASEESV